jgi:hypothetical protein
MLAWRSRTLARGLRMNWLDRIPLYVLVPLALALGLAPFVPEPHLWQKLKMLAAGTLSRPIDVFDLFYHAAPVILLVIRLARIARRTGGGGSPGR